MAKEPADGLIIDTHQHLWDLSKPKPAAGDGVTADSRAYAEAAKGLDVLAVYMEVDTPPAMQPVEAENVIELCRAKTTVTRAAVIGGRPDAAGFAEYIRRFKGSPFVRGVRQVLHGGATPAGTCLKDDFVNGIRLLGKLGMSFDLCMRPGELGDGLQLTKLAPETRFVLDHCGNADPNAFLPAAGGEKLSHDPDAWKRAVDSLAKRPNVICKISGIVASAPEKWSADHLTPIVNHCLDAFGPDRVMFGGDWPVCLKRAKLIEWVDALKQIVAARPAAEQRKLWSENAKAFFSLEV